MNDRLVAPDFESQKVRHENTRMAARLVSFVRMDTGVAVCSFAMSEHTARFRRVVQALAQKAVPSIQK